MLDLNTVAAASDEVSRFKNVGVANVFLHHGWKQVKELRERLRGLHIHYPRSLDGCICGAVGGKRAIALATSVVGLSRPDGHWSVAALIQSTPPQRVEGQRQCTHVYLAELAQAGDMKRFNSA